MRVWSIVLDYLSFLPPAFLCFLPMKDLLRFSRRRTLAIVGGAMLVSMLALGWAQYRFALESNAVLLPMLAVCFAAYRSCLRATAWQSVSIFCASLALMSVLSNIATCTGALWFGGSGEAEGLQRPLLQLCLNTVFSAALALPYARTGSFIVRTKQQNRGWQTMTLYFVIVFAANMLLLPIEDAVIGDAEKTVYMLLILAAVLSLLLLMHVIFYYTVSGIMAQEKALDRSRFLETQESQFAAQLYIVAVNSFNGVVKQKDGRYLSTDHAGAGIGLSSVASTAEGYGGVARFSHKGTEFYSNVAIPLE